MSTADLFQLDAELGSENDDEDFDEETGEVRQRQNGGVAGFEDSSEEEEDDDDEEAARAVREGFIVDEEDEDDDEAERQRKQKRKRRREEREDEALDEDDLDLIGIRQEPAPTETKRLKRLKRGHRGDRDRDEPRGLDDIFADDNEEEEFEERRLGTAREGEFDDFIEEDDPSDDDRAQRLDDAEVSRRPKQMLAGLRDLRMSGLDEGDMEDMAAAFGDGTEYDWALQLQEQEEEDETHPNKDLELKDVFEPSQLEAKLLTEEDVVIKNTDVPERFQLARKPFLRQEISEEEWAQIGRDEKKWVSNLMWPKKEFSEDLHQPFIDAVGDVLYLFNVKDFEVPYIFQHRKDHLIYAVKVPSQEDPNDPDAPAYEIRAEKLLDQNDLWEIFELDLKYRGLREKKAALQGIYDDLKTNLGVQDDTVEDMLPSAVLLEEVQDIHDYVSFQYAAELKDQELSQPNGVESAEDHRKRPSAAAGVFAKIRAGKAYNVVRAFGTTADAFAQRVLDTGKRGYTDDPTEAPEDMADNFVDAEEYQTSSQLLKGAKAMFAEEIVMSPRVRKLMRQTYYENGRFDCFRTEKGLRKIDEDNPFYEFKYLRNQSLKVFGKRPELFLRMLKAESDGLVEVKFRLKNEQSFKKTLYKNLESDNFSEVADAWNSLRREALDQALLKLERIMVKGVKENLRSECEKMIAQKCRKVYSTKLDQAPYKPRGMVLGTEPRVLALTNGRGAGDRDAVVWAWVEEDGRVLENGKFTDMRLGNPEKAKPDGKDVEAFVELVNRRKPDVIGVSGFSVETRTLYKELQAIVEQHDLRGTEYEDEDGNEQRDKIDVVMVNDEVARLYHTSDRAKLDHPGFAPLTKYCVGLARYLQNPLKEYASLGRDIVSISFNPNQILIPQEKLMKALETSMVDMVNLVGVDINKAVNETYTNNLLPYVCGLGPRKANMMVQAINRNGGEVHSRQDLVGDMDGRIQAVGFNVWENCASFLFVEYDPMEPTNEYLDNTRVHPEDYELGRKMASDTLEMDEEDVKAETEENGSTSIVRRLVRENMQEKVNELRLEMYAEQLENIFHQKKRATLETIRAELQQPYEELRRNFALLNTDEVFTMLTGETPESLIEGMIVPVSIRKVFPEHIECRLDCGIEGGVSESEFPAGVGMDGVDTRRAYQPHQTVQAKLVYLNRKQLTAQLSLREDSLRRPFRREIDRMPGEWDQTQEDADKREAEKRTEDSTGRAQRVIKHPMFRNFNSQQAEEYLGQQPPGEVVIRPSSKGLDHLTVSWKVADGIYKHIDVLELDKENEFSVGRTLKVDGKYTYSDLDEMIVNHVKAMAKKVNEIMQDERYQNGTKASTGKQDVKRLSCGQAVDVTRKTEDWLKSYMEANPRRSRYAFTLNREYPGYFWLVFKSSAHKPCDSWPIKVIPNAFELQKNPYPDMDSLKNGFKTLYVSWQNKAKQPNPGANAHSRVQAPPGTSMSGRPSGGYPPAPRVGGRY